MDARYGDGPAYSYELPWDAMRKAEIDATILRLATQPLDAPRQTGPTLDLGCGDQPAARFWPHQDITGVEISPTAVARVAQAFPWMRVHCSPAETFTDPEGRTYSTIVSIESIEHWCDVGAGLATVRRHLAPDGWFVFSTPNRDSLHRRIGSKLGLEVPYCSSDHTHEFGFTEMRTLLQRHGWRIERSEGVFLMPWWALESEFGGRIRALTDRDPEILTWLRSLGRGCPELAFIQVHACRRSP
jgi:SAM-dependent methyltransferase